MIQMNQLTTISQLASWLANIPIELPGRSITSGREKDQIVNCSHDTLMNGIHSNIDCWSITKQMPATN